MTPLGLTGHPAPIGDGEHGRRIEAVRSALAERDLDVLLAYGAHRDYQPADLRWLARWYCVEEETACVEQPAEPAADHSEARLVAYSMVLDGKPREEVAQHLADDFGLADSDALLDDLYARAG